MPYPEILSWAGALTETLGGVFLVIGFLSRLISIPVIIFFIVAYSFVHIESLRHFTTNPQAFTKEAPFPFILTALLVLAFGPGLFSVDGLISKKNGDK